MLEYKSNYWHQELEPYLEELLTIVAKSSANNRGVTAVGHKEIEVETWPSMLEKSAKHSGVATAGKDVVAAGRDVTATEKGITTAEKERRKC